MKVQTASWRVDRMNQIDLSEPKGNAFFLIGQAKMWAKELDLDADAISKEM